MRIVHKIKLATHCLWKYHSGCRLVKNNVILHWNEWATVHWDSRAYGNSEYIWKRLDLWKTFTTLSGWAFQLPAVYCQPMAGKSTFSQKYDHSGEQLRPEDLLFNIFLKQLW